MFYLVFVYFELLYRSKVTVS